MLFTHEGQCRFKIKNVVVLVKGSGDGALGEAIGEIMVEVMTVYLNRGM